MQIHRLEFGALGPFAGEHAIDFDALGGSSLFLIDGPTGAGKSTVIDAIVFALYGSVAGEASDRQRLRSDFAAPDAASFAELDFSTAFGRYRVRRTPEYERAKRRGSGTTTATSTVSLMRSTGSEGWEPVSSRHGEVDAEITRLVGLTRAQFLQTVVLPQGEFAAFLSAESKDRLAVLERIFATDLYSRIEQALDDRRRAAQATREDADATLAQRLRHVTSRLPDADREQAGIDGASLVAFDGLAALVDRVRARQADDETRVDVGHGRVAGLTGRVRVLEDRARAEERCTLTRADLDQSRGAAEGARRGLERHAELLRGLGAQADDPQAARSMVDRALGSLDAAVQAEGRLDSDRAAVLAQQREVARADDRIRGLEAERGDALPARLLALTEVLEARAGEAEQAALAASSAEEAVFRDRLDGMAAELAADLADGRACPVCGSRVHPDPARHEGRPVTAADLADAARERNQAERRRQQAEVDRTTLAAVSLPRPGRAAAADGASGDRPVPTLTSRQVQAELGALRTRAGEIADELEAARQTRAEAASALAALQAALTEHRSLVAAAVGQHDTVAERVAVLRTLHSALDAVIEAGDAVVAAEARAAEAARELGDLVAAAPDGGVPGGDGDLAELAAQLEAATEELRAATSRRDATVSLIADLDDRVADAQAAQRAREACWEDTADIIWLANVAKGSTGNRLSQPLSAYVVQTMFDEILEAANRRLRSMLDGRFELRSTEERTGRRLLGLGLGLEVLDLRTETVRRTSTLSGGETFCASLALALGLADTVRANAGGIEIGILLIDEGFGSLDGERLDEVMAELLRLRADGRTVGVISHVTEMKRSIMERIDVQPLDARRGSTLGVSWMA